MNDNQTSSLSLFSKRWLAETQRLLENAHPLTDDSAAMAAALKQGNDIEQRILLRAQYLGERNGSLSLLLQWRQVANWILVTSLALALFGGFSSALAILGDGSRAVNVVWLLGGLIGFNLLMLLFWAINLLLRLTGGGGQGGMLGRIWFFVTGWLAQRLLAVESAGSGVNARHAGLLSRAQKELMNRSKSGFWFMSTATHLLWLFVSLGILLGMLLSLALRSYGFIWETTILPAGAFIEFVGLFGWLPAQIGFAVPDAEAIRNSGVTSNMVGMGAAAEWQDETVRRAWSSWLLGSLCIYGILPRLLLSLVCWRLVTSRLAGLRLDQSVPTYAALAARLQADSEAAGISDKQSAELYRTRIGASSAEGNGKSVMIGLELLDENAWQSISRAPGMSPDVLVLAPVDSREQRSEALRELARDTSSRLLVVCDPHLSPDRGLMNWIVDASWHSVEIRVLLLSDKNVDPARLESWQERLQQTGLPTERIFLTSQPALQWISHGTSH